MKSGTKRLTIEEVEKVKELYKQRLNYSAIGRTMDPPRHRTTIMLLIKRLENPLYRINRKKENGKPMKEIKDIKVLEEVIKKSDKCLYCGKEKTGKFKESNYCSPECWDEDLGKKIKYY